MEPVTAADILRNREQRRQALQLAHSPNIMGEFWAREGCRCYTCRDVLDPTGEEDAAAANASNTRPVTPPPLSTPPGDGIGLLTPAPAHLSSPPPLLRSSSRAEPDFVGDAIASLRMKCEELRAKQDAVYEKETNSHDEMAAQDIEWEELDEMIGKLERAIEILESI